MPELLRKLVRVGIAASVLCSIATSTWAQPAGPRGVPKPPDPGPLFFSEQWRNPKTYAEGVLPLTSVTQEVVTTPNLQLAVYDPNAKYIPEYRKTLRPGSWATDWEGPTCLRILRRRDARDLGGLVWTGNSDAARQEQLRGFVEPRPRHLAHVCLGIPRSETRRETGRRDVSRWRPWHRHTRRRAHRERGGLVLVAVAEADVPQTAHAARGWRSRICRGWTR